MRWFLKRKRNIFIIYLILSLALLTGCWDNRDIEEVSFNLGIALDQADGDIKLEGEPPVITATFQNLAPKVTISGQAEIDFDNISITGNTISKISTELALLNPGTIISQHLKTIAISENLARHMNLENLLNDFQRNINTRISTNILIAKGNAKSVFEKNLGEKGNAIPALKILRIIDNDDFSLRLLKPATLAIVGDRLASEQSFLLPRVQKKGNEIVLEDAAVISGKTKKMVGLINSEEVNGFRWLVGKKGGGRLNIFNRKNNLIFTIQIFHMSSEIIPHVRGNQISFDVNVYGEGTLIEDWIENADAADNRFLQKLEKEAEQKIVYQMRSVLYKLQKQFRADVVGFGEALRIKYPQTFQKVKQNWDEMFADVPIEVHADLKIRNYGVKIKK
ncbi:Ger(x)C family spore germination protein [Thermoactinomyces mirandus]|uniref:Ger(X)C family spore germination protein n=1 Tax=Thermoactinomyces mirandus TaxID=2756294 RepID=A0A7W2ASM0_9BACL|nr:Ger(x)C family spore germination protein [Thermoactinomyces mirandus]MBA4602810.1 Ger(x)C family spore germination protein [Thermoactinomyces mirandus]